MGILSPLREALRAVAATDVQDDTDSLNGRRRQSSPRDVRLKEMMPMDQVGGWLELPRPIRVLAVVTFPVGGFRTFMRYTYSGFDERRFTFDILACDSPEIEALRKDMAEFPSGRLMVSRDFRGHRLLIWTIFCALRSGVYDVVHSQGLFAGLSVCLVNFLFRVPHVITIHGLLEDSDLRGPAFLRRQEVRFLTRVLGSARVIHHVGWDMAERYRQIMPGLEGSGCKIEVIPHGIRPQPYADVRRMKSGPIRRQLGLSDDILLFGYLGRFMDRKGFPVLIEAVEAAERGSLIGRDYRIVAVGSGDRKKPYERLIRSKGLAHRMVFLPFQHDIAPILAELDCVVMPSLWEAWGLLATEVLCAGVPLIASDCLGLREAVRDTPAISVRTGDKSALAEALADFAKSLPYPTFESFRKEACHRFDVRRSSAALEAVFDRFVAGV
jgi:glycosyltransferase involved in cell wall biosynthesis